MADRIYPRFAHLATGEWLWDVARQSGRFVRAVVRSSREQNEGDARKAAAEAMKRIEEEARR
jgi:hypothetical protein